MSILKYFLCTTIIISFLTPVTILAQQQGAAFTLSADDESLEWGNCPAFMPESCSLSVLQGNPQEPSADVFFKMQGNTAVPNHWHHSAERMVLVSGEMEVNYEGQDPVVITPGMYAYGPPELPHTASCQSDEPCVLFIAFDKPIDAFAVK
jgi:quercetin dioxygenase-like cupin family protein